MVSLKKVHHLLIFGLLLGGLSSCQLGYIAESAYYQADLMRRRVPLQYALDHYTLTDEEKQKIQLAIKLRQFMSTQLKLNTEDNFSRYVHLKQPYVTYAVNAARKDQLKAYTWSFPIIGKVPYKAYFKKESAIKEADEMNEKNLDTYVRGVSAYSTLGWFEDPLLSSMLRMKEHQFANTLIHETVHANLYINGQSKFNERVASFLGQLGAEAYYKSQNRGEDLKSIVANETHDELLFSEFISRELKGLRQWYKENKNQPDIETAREQQFARMKQNFKASLQGKLKTKNYDWFLAKKFNNAFLLLLELYNSDFSQLEKLANHYNRDFIQVFNRLKELEETDNPEQALTKMIDSL